MRYENIQQEKGLFTFYKQQQAEEDQIRRMLKKRKKGKSKKQKKPLANIRQDPSLPNHKFRNLAITQVGETKEMSTYKNFLRNVISKQNSQSMLNQQHLPCSVRLKTDTCEKPYQKQELVNYLMKNKLQAHKESFINLLKQREAKNINKTQAENSNNKIGSVQTKVQSLQNITKNQQTSKKNQELRFTKGEKKFESRSFLEKLKHLQLSNKSNLISNRDSIYIHQKQPNDLHQENKKYFHKLISNFYRHSQQKNQTGYKMIKETLKFPNIIKTDKILRLKTQQQSPIQTKAKIMTPLKQFVSNRKQIKRKSSNEKYKELLHLDWVKQTNANEGRQLNFIDLSKDYSRQRIQSQQRVKKKRLVRSRLGLEL